MGALTAAAVAGLLMLGLAGSAAAEPTPLAVVRKVMATAPGKMPQSIRCVSPQELRQEIRRANGRVPANPLGVALRRSRRILLDWKKVCLPIHRYETGHPVDSVNLVWALSAVFHEKAHIQGIHAEWKATCWAIRPTLKQLRRWGIKADDLEKVQHYLTHTLDGYRPEEYKLYGRCRV